MWNYAELAHVAKQSGGPEALVKTILNTGLKNGRIEGACATIILGGAVYGIYRLHKFVNDYINMDEDYVMAKNEIINKSNEYNQDGEIIDSLEGEKYVES